MDRLNAELLKRLDALEHERVQRERQLDAQFERTYAELRAQNLSNWLISTTSGRRSLATPTSSTASMSESLAHSPSRKHDLKSARYSFQRSPFQQYATAPASAPALRTSKSAVAQPPGGPFENSERREQLRRDRMAETSTMSLDAISQEETTRTSTGAHDRPDYHSINTSGNIQRTSDSTTIGSHRVKFQEATSPARAAAAGESPLGTARSQRGIVPFSSDSASAQEIEKLAAFHRDTRRPLLPIEAFVFAGIKTNSTSVLQFDILYVRGV